MTPEQAMAQWQQWGIKSEPSLTQTLANGKTNQVFLLAADNQQLVLRIYSNVSNKALRSQAHAIQQSVNTIGLAPRLIYSQANGLYSVSEHLAGDTLNKKTSLTNNDVLLLCDAINRYQLLPAPTHPIDYNAVLTAYRHQLINRLCWKPDDELKFSATLELCKELKQIHLHCAPVLSHHDLNPYNIIRQPQRATGFSFIDWEFACASYPSIDYAILLVELNIDRATLANISGIEKHTLNTAASIYSYVCKLYWLTQPNKNSE